MSELILILKNLLRKKLRTTFAIAGVAVGVAAMVAMVSLSRGFLNEFRGLASKYRGDLSVQLENVPDPRYSRVPASLIEEFGTWPEVDKSYPFVFSGMSVQGDKYFIVFGMPDDCDLLQSHKLQAGGDYFRDGKQEVLLGSRAAEKFGKSVGDSFEIRSEIFTVSGIYEVEIRAMNYACILDIEDAIRVTGLGDATLALLELKDPEKDIEAVTARVKAEHPKYEAYKPADFFDQFEEATFIERMGLSMSIVAMAIAAIGILNTMMMSVYERTREIGLLRALGWSAGRVLFMILGEGVLISTIGGVTGIVMGCLGTKLLIQSIDLGIINGQITLDLIALAMGLAIGGGVIGSLAPAWKASRFSPTEALRHE